MKGQREESQSYLSHSGLKIKNIRGVHSSTPLINWEWSDVMTIHEILTEVKNANFKCAYENSNVIFDSIFKIFELDDDYIRNNKDTLQDLIDIITIGNITYNYSDSDILPIDDGVYDLLVEKLKRIDYSKFTPGAYPMKTQLNNNTYRAKLDTPELQKPFTVMDKEDTKKLEEAFYPSILNYTKPIDLRCYLYKPFIIDDPNMYISKRIRTVSHNYPQLVGTLDKCKFVLDAQAKELGVYDESNVAIFERDFMVPLLQDGLINMSDNISMIGTLKYDGVSIEADVTDHIIAARTRGDTDYNVASDVTPIFEGYTFPAATELQLDRPIGMKFEAIVKYDDLRRMNEIFGTSYINGRTAIIGILGSSDGWKFRNFITLVPLQVDFGDIPIDEMNRLAEIEFLNRYYATREYLRYVCFNSPYHMLMFEIKKYVEEAEYFRAWSQFMYDGVVLEFFDNNLRAILGRKNSINQYAMAIKFNPLKRITIFTGYTYTVGQNGVITPMIHYNPIEFMGAIHTKSTGSSYERFTNLNLYVGDEIYVTYVNDVMPYVTNLDSEHNRTNHNRQPNPDEIFPKYCPCCGSELKMSANGKTVYCPNMDCKDRKKQRLSNMLSKMDIKDFSDAAVEMLGNKSFHEMLNMSVEDFSVLGPTDSYKFYKQLQDLKVNGLPDYRIIGALGFTNVASKKWKLIFEKYSLLEIFHLYLATKGNNDHIVTHDGKEYDSLCDLISNIKGVGPITAQTIVSELPYFEKDIEYIINNINYTQTSIGERSVKYKIRFSGFRDPELAAVLNRFPFVDCDSDSGVTRDTTILLVPSTGCNPTSKMIKAKKYGIPIVSVNDFLECPNLYIPEIDNVEM